MTLLIMRALCALTVLHPGREGQGVLIKALDELFAAFWVEHRKTNEKEVLGQVLEKAIGAEETKRGMYTQNVLRREKRADLILSSYGDGRERRERSSWEEYRQGSCGWCFWASVVVCTFPSHA